MNATGMQRLIGKAAIVTGAGRGIGRAIAQRLAGEGCSVMLADVNSELAATAAAALQETGATAIPLAVDVTDQSQVQDMVAAAVQRWGRLDIVVNNAFGHIAGALGSALEVTDEGWHSAVAMIQDAVWFACRHAIPHLRAAGGGSIVNIASVHGIQMAPGRFTYATGKGAMIAMTRQLACDFGPDSIRVNAVCPGHIVTEQNGDQFRDHPTTHDYYQVQYPLRRTGVPDDIAAGVAYLCSDDASFITGHTLVIDGGLTVQLQEDLAVRMGRYLREHPETELPDP